MNRQDFLSAETIANSKPLWNKHVASLGCPEDFDELSYADRLDYVAALITGEETAAERQERRRREYRPAPVRESRYDRYDPQGPDTREEYYS